MAVWSDVGTTIPTLLWAPGHTGQFPSLLVVCVPWMSSACEGAGFRGDRERCSAILALLPPASSSIFPYISKIAVSASPSLQDFETVIYKLLQNTGKG